MHLHGNRKDLSGLIFGRLKVLEQAPKNSHARTRWLCSCTCGNMKSVATQELLRGKTKSCGCYKKEMAPFHKRLRPFEATYNVLVTTATNSKHELGLSYEEYLEFTKTGNCHYCDVVIPWNPYTAGKNNCYYLDRKDNSKGYSVGNCVVCCSRCNWAKGSNFSYEEWKEIGKTIKIFRETA